jgi:DNA-binding TFAR19-related protein (PDSD5 family)
VIVSEETGRISVAADGRMHTRLDDERLRALLDRLLGSRANGARP